MKHLQSALFFILGILVVNSAIAAKIIHPYEEIEQAFKNFYHEKLELSEHLFDNGYYSSGLIFFNDELEKENLLTEKIEEEKEILDEIKQSLLTKFAYASLSLEEKEGFANIIYGFLKNMDVEIYLIDREILFSLPVIELNYSCSVAWPTKAIVLLKKNHSDETESVAYYIASDVCD